ncbi:MAG: hypothetical protein V4686_01030 [Patescibacteria group bacterium]
MHKSSLKDSLVKTYHDVEEKFEDVLYEKWHIRLHRKAKHHVHRLRKKPDHHKDVIAFSVAFLVTSAVFVGWYFISFPRIIDSYSINKKENNALNVSSNPFADIKDRLADTNIEAQ